MMPDQPLLVFVGYLGYFGGIAGCLYTNEMGVFLSKKFEISKCGVTLALKSGKSILPIPFSGEAESLD